MIEGFYVHLYTDLLQIIRMDHRSRVLWLCHVLKTMSHNTVTVFLILTVFMPTILLCSLKLWRAWTFNNHSQSSCQSWVSTLITSWYIKKNIYGKQTNKQRKNPHYNANVQLCDHTNKFNMHITYLDLPTPWASQ